MNHYFYGRMMKKYLLLVFLLIPFFGKGQQTYITCKDSTRADPYHQCYDCYQPVCGCDGKTYRNQCAAQYWGGLVGVTPNNPGICDNFDFDFSPNPVSAFSKTGCDNLLYVYVKQSLLPTSISIYLFDVFDRIQFSRYLYLYDNSSTGQGTAVTDLNVDFFAGLQKGVYLLVVSLNGEYKAKKILKVNIE
ncbi:MAG: Kazal-type serine protease inhibitor family protein [Bacteroidetes bacterium]|nr:Kazal-type serine protease inhibitor family protein [Bacteroidota bacterium]